MVCDRRLNGSTQSGVALLVALVVVAIAASLASWISVSQQVWMRQTENLRDLEQSQAVTDGAIDLAAVSLDQEGQNTSDDDLTQRWAQPLPFFPVAGGTVTARIQDAEARFNLNNLFHDGSPDPNQIGVFQRLLVAAGLNPNLTSGVIQWMTPASVQGTQQMADSLYLGLKVPYRVGSQPFQDATELTLVNGFPQAVYETLRPWVTVLPVSFGVTPINVDTAPAPVLAALFPTVPATTIAALVAARNTKPFVTAAQMTALLPTGTTLPPVPYGIRSDYFEVVIATQFGRLQRLTEAMIYRPLGGKPAQVLWANRYWPA